MRGVTSQFHKVQPAPDRRSPRDSGRLKAGLRPYRETIDATGLGTVDKMREKKRDAYRVSTIYVITAMKGTGHARRKTSNDRTLLRRP